MEQKEMLERLKQDPGALRAVMSSPDGQTLLRLLSGEDGGAGLRQAAQQAAAGDNRQMLGMIRQIMASPQGAELVQRLNDSLRQ